MNWASTSCTFQVAQRFKCHSNETRELDELAPNRFAISWDTWTGLMMAGLIISRMVFRCSTKIRRKKRGAEPLSPSLYSVSRSWRKSRTQAKGLKEKTKRLHLRLACHTPDIPSPPPWEGGSCPQGKIWNTHVLPHFHRMPFHNSTCNGHDCLHNVLSGLKHVLSGWARVLNKNHWSRLLCAKCAWERYSRDGLQRLQGKFGTGHLRQVMWMADLLFFDVTALGWKQIADLSFSDV